MKLVSLMLPVAMAFSIQAFSKMKMPWKEKVQVISSVETELSVLLGRRLPDVDEAYGYNGESLWRSIIDEEQPAA